MSVELKQAKLAKIDADLARLWSRLHRTARAIDKLQARRQRLIAPRKLTPEEMQ